MRVLNAEEMRRYDQAAFEQLGLPSLTFMENAGRAITQVIFESFGDRLSRNVLVVAGGGNNGGDGFCIARTLALQGVSVSVWCVKRLEEMQGDLVAQAQAFRRTGGVIFELPWIENWIERFETELQSSSLVVDALLGTGFSGSLKDPYSPLIDTINRSGLPVVSVDIPSGVDASSGKVESTAVNADITVAVQYPKIGHLLFPGAAYVGEVIVCDVGIPAQCDVETSPVTREVLTADTIRTHLSQHFTKDPQKHKGKKGHVVVIGGSAGHFGAPRMSAEAALKCGAGLVTLVLPQSAARIIAPELVELMCASLPDDSDGNYAPPLPEKVQAIVENKNAIVIGPGLGESEGARALVKEIFSHCGRTKTPLIVDADALNLLSKDPSLRLVLPEHAVLTPHPGEMARMLGVTTSEVQELRLESAVVLGKALNALVVLKGARTIIADTKGNLAINPTATDVLATAGSGDVLSGMIGALLGRGMSPLDAACCAVYVHGRIGELLEERLMSTAGVVASDIIRTVPEVFALLLNSTKRKPALRYPLIRRVRDSKLHD